MQARTQVSAQVRTQAYLSSCYEQTYILPRK